MGVRTGGGRVGGRRPNIFAWSEKSVYKKNENEKKRRKVCFLMQQVFVRFTGVIFANRDNCPQGLKD